MKLTAIIRKAMIMQFRDLWALILTFAAAPFFILIYYLMTSGASTTYQVLLHFPPGFDREVKREITASLAEVTYNNGPPALVLTELADTAQSVRLLADRKADLGLVIPLSFCDSLENGGPPHFIISGEAGNPKYSVGLIFVITGLEAMIKKHNPQTPLYTFEEKFAGNSLAKSEFDIYAPGILVFSMIMLILSCSLAFIRDVEDRTMLRLKISRMTVFDYLLGNTIVQWIIGILSFGTCLGLAVQLGFSSAGSLWLVLLVCSLTILSVIAISLILVAFCKNATMVMIIGNFPLFILMFFSGSMIPLPRTELVGQFALNDLLPPTHAVIAMNKIFTYGTGFSGIGYEMTMLAGLTVLYYAAGVVLFKRRHMTEG